METRTITTLEELRQCAHEILAALTPTQHATVLTLQGDLGAGKTALTKECARELSVSGEITSPTFVIMKSYPVPADTRFTTLVHIDAYRIEADDEMRVLGLEELLKDPQNLVVIEWPERIAKLIPEDAHRVTLTLHGQTRTLTYDK